MEKTKKYERYQVVTDDGSRDHEKYSDAVRDYWRSTAPKTLYGITFEGDFCVVMSK